MNASNILLGALLAFFALAAWNAFRPLRERLRTLLDQEREIQALAVDAAKLQVAVEGLTKSLSECFVRAEFAQRTALALPHPEQLAPLLKLAERVEALELAQKGMLLEVMDKAEKVAAKLADRERKRNGRSEPNHEAADVEDEAEWWARVRRAHPLPGLPTGDPAQPIAFAESEGDVS